MPLTVGDKLGPYEILAPIGAGGMGEVYRARDPRLNRDVAIKVSATQFSERFEREAKAIAALNHPNICHLYDVGPNYLVMEYIEGEAPQGPLPLEEVLRITRQIADALEAAHEKGITHRDLKPGNIKIKPDGTVKVLDFGLAKVDATSGVSQSENSPTLSMAATQMGVILGTAGYMSPEQARGKAVDKRADIWAFGVVFYELLIGKRLFQGEDVSHTMAAVIMQEPKLDAVPVQVRKLLQRCLEKDPKKRLRDIGDARILLEDQAPVSVPIVESRTSRAGLLAGIAAGVLAVIAAATSFIAWRATRTVEHPLVRLDVDLGSDVALEPPGFDGASVILSPDGTRIVYVASIGGGPNKLYLRRLDQPKAMELAGTENASGPFFSPDGQWIGFNYGVPGTRINKVSIEGGAVVPVADGVGGATAWGETGDIFFAMVGKGLNRVSQAASAPEQVVAPANGELTDWFPQVLPGGKALLSSNYTSPNADTASIEAISLADHRRKTLARGGTTPRYFPSSDGSGYLLYANKTTLFAVRFDSEKLETRGTAVPILDDVGEDPSAGVSQYAISAADRGTLVYRRAAGATGVGLSGLRWLDSAGKSEPLAVKSGGYDTPRVSPDGKRIAMVVRQPGADIWVYEWQRDAWTKLSFGGAIYFSPVWSPDGRYVVFGSVGKGILWTRADGAGQPQPLIPSNAVLTPFSFSPDGKRLVYTEVAASGPNPQIWTASLEDNGGQLKAGRPDQFLKDGFADVLPAVSPDGRWVAYTSDESGMFQVYVRAFPRVAGHDGRWLISAGPGQLPTWSSNGRDLLYQSGDQIMAVSYTAKGDSFVPDKPRVAWAKLGIPQIALRLWDLAPDAKRLMVVAPVSNSGTPKAEHEVVLLQNFFDELRRRLPSK